MENTLLYAGADLGFSRGGGADFQKIVTKKSRFFGARSPSKLVYIFEKFLKNFDKKIAFFWRALPLKISIYWRRRRL